MEPAEFPTLSNILKPAKIFVVKLSPTKIIFLFETQEKVRLRSLMAVVTHVKAVLSISSSSRTGLDASKDMTNKWKIRPASLSLIFSFIFLFFISIDYFLWKMQLLCVAAVVFDRSHVVTSSKFYDTHFCKQSGTCRGLQICDNVSSNVSCVTTTSKLNFRHEFRNDMHITKLQSYQSCISCNHMTLLHDTTK